eukprot:SAG31_NODE_1674_length_7560_cov_2.804852_5_plen_56_part_00
MLQVASDLEPSHNVAALAVEVHLICVSFLYESVSAILCNDSHRDVLVSCRPTWQI